MAKVHFERVTVPALSSKTTRTRVTVCITYIRSLIVVTFAGSEGVLWFGARNTINQLPFATGKQTLFLSTFHTISHYRNDRHQDRKKLLHYLLLHSVLRNWFDRHSQEERIAITDWIFTVAKLFSEEVKVKMRIIARKVDWKKKKVRRSGQIATPYGELFTFNETS